MKLRAPAECRSVSFNGGLIAIDEEGCIDIDGSAADALIWHGFEPVLDQGSDSESRAFVDISSLSRKELFQFLKEHNVSISLPITNEALRNHATRLLQNLPEARRSR